MQGPLPAPSATGSLVKTPFPHLLVYALERRLTGTFELSRGSMSMATMLVMGGCPSKLRTSDPVHFLGNVLLELGMITPAQLQGSLAGMNGPNGPRLLGQLLLEMNAIDQARLDAGLRSQVERKVEHLFGLSSDTTFAYYDNVDLLSRYGGPPTPIDPFPVLWRGCRDQPALEHVDATYRRAGAALLRPAPTAQLDRFAFAPQEREVVELIRQRPTRAIDVTAMLGSRLGQTLVYFLMIMKQVDLIDATQSMPSAPAPAPSSNPAASVQGSKPNSQAFARLQLQRQAAPSRGPMVVEESVAAGRHDDRAAPSSGPIPASPSAFGSAFAAPIQPPQTPIVSTPVDPVVPVPVAAPAGSLDLGAMITATINSSAPPAMSSSPPGPSINIPPASKAPSIPPGGEPDLTDEQRSLKQKIIDRAATITSQDYFQMLGIERDATTEQIQKAFFTLAKVWHPDRLPPALLDVKDACSKVFTHLTEANQILTDPSKRQDYMKLLKEGGATPEDQAKIQAIIEAATDFQKAEVLLRRHPNDREAYELVQKCVQLDPEQADYLATLAWLDSQKPEWLSREKTLEKCRILDRCIKMNPHCERAYFYRGMLYKRAEEGMKALKDFKKAAELNPRNLDAMREVRLHNMRGGQRPSTNPSAPPQATEKLGGLFGKLFKK